MRIYFPQIIFLISGLLLSASIVSPAQTDQALFISDEDHWVDSVMQSLSLEERIGQLMIVRANTPGEKYYPVIDQYIRQYNIGGVTFFGGNPTAQAIQTNHWQSIARTPLFISIDGEWGVAMRLDSITPFPYQMTLGAIADDSLLYRMGLEVARQCQRMGIHMNFAPVVDINSNPNNPVIHMRSFGENRELVSAKGIMYMKGMQDGGLIVTAKHFPGHGDTDADSHHTLPVIHHSKERLDSVELYPFRQLIAAGLDGIMIAHLFIPSLDETANTPSTLSGLVVTGLLRKELGFDGLIVTDALDMKGVTLHHKPGEIELKALQAGNDILLLSTKLPEAIQYLKKAVRHGELDAGLIDERCEKVLRYKYRAGLYNMAPVNTVNLVHDLNSAGAEVANRKLFREAVTIVKNNNDILPLKRLDTLKVASVAIGYGRTTPFQERLAWYAPVSLFALKKTPSEKEVSTLLKQLEPYNLVIISLQNTNTWGGSPYGISREALNFTAEAAKRKTVILNLFATPYALDLLEGQTQPAAIVLSYQDHPDMQDISAQVIFGGIPAKGTLPVSAGSLFASGTGYKTGSIRMAYAIPEELGIIRQYLEPVDSMVERCISQRVFPGCQVWAAKDGKVFYAKSFGHHTYAKENPVNSFDLYDVASLTKVAAGTISVMRMVDEGKIDIDRYLQDYLPYLKGTDKGKIIIREMMAHQARLKPWIPYFKYVNEDGKPDPAVFSATVSEDFPIRVAENLYIRMDYDHVIIDSIIASPLQNTKAYKYSDLGFYFIPQIIHNLTYQHYDDYLDYTFYRPMGLSTLCFTPRGHFPLNRIVPTEDDKIFRGQLLHGDVHDPGAAMMGGISAHAGVFSNANDFGIICQMLLQGGTYGGEQYLQEATIKEFTRRQFPLNQNRRGIGFDKPFPEYSINGSACKSASPASYGHSGFTGTYLWIDPENGLVFVFLSNRVHPDANNNKLARQNIRPELHQLFYNAILKSQQNNNN
ncbi:MAG: glycoside hydrolase family 3 N-terminal domain-containing protein [Bacteroidales bacterium]